MREPRRKNISREAATNALRVVDNGDGTYRLALCDELGEIGSWPFTDVGNENLAATMRVLSQYIQSGDSQLYTSLSSIIDIQPEGSETEFTATEAMVQYAFNSQEFFVLDESIFAAADGEVLLDCMDLLAAAIIALF